jgi:hypothetical protein
MEFGFYAEIEVSIINRRIQPLEPIRLSNIEINFNSIEAGTNATNS